MGKYFFVPLWLALVALLAGLAFSDDETIVACVILAVVACVMLFRWRTWWSLADSVDDAGDALIARRGGAEQRIDFAGIRDVTFRAARPPRVVLHLDRSGPFGGEVVFVPHNASWNPFASSHPLAEQLMHRVLQARAAGAATQ